MGPSPDDSGVVPIGSVLDGRYRVDSLLGKGGMGRVYKAEHTGIGRAVAIKILHPDLGRNKEASQRFKREASASGRLDHVNIVGVSDFGELDDGCLYLVMEALEGEGLGARLEREKRIPWPEAIEIIRGVLSGLRHAHEKNVVHRDIKPDNIFLAKKDGDTVVKILDFGIAKLMAGEGNDPATTRAGLTVGTPAYLSPEQAVGGEIKAATDLYSTSVVFYEMLAGRPPFEDTDPLAIMTAHVSRNPPPFAEVAKDLKLPKGLEQVIMRGLEKVSAERISSASDYIAQLDEVLRNAGFAVPTMARASGAVAIPTPPPGSLAMPQPAATPMPFATAPKPAAPTASFTPMPFETSRAQRAVSLADVSEPIPRKWLVIAGIVLLAAIAIAIALKVGAGGSKATEPPKRDKHSEVETAPVQARTPMFPVAGSKEPNADLLLKATLLDLQSGATCTDRKAAVAKLVELGDPRAIPPLKTARFRMRGGVLGFGDSNTNACLKADAEAAIKALGGT